MLRWAAMALGAVMLPLAFVAAVSTGKRIGQYGFTPDRLWARGRSVAIAAAFALAYLYALVRGRAGWAGTAFARPMSGSPIGICLLALFLALPIVSFGAISTRDQLARLESGQVAPGRVRLGGDALRFRPVRPPGARAARSERATPEIRQRAQAALAREEPLGHRWHRTSRAPERRAASRPAA